MEGEGGREGGREGGQGRGEALNNVNCIRLVFTCIHV